MARGSVKGALPAEDAARIHLHDTTMDVALAEGRNIWEAQAAALRAVVEADRAAQAAGPTQRAPIPDDWQEATA